MPRLRRHPSLWPRVLAVLLAGCCWTAAPDPALAFGKNKLRTQEFRWQIFETEHCEIFYYPEEEALAREVCRLAEDAFERSVRLLRYRPQDKVPLFLYRTSGEFQQTTLIPSVIGVGTGGFTEAFKNRIALPATPSPRELARVIRHEMQHAFQFNILYGEGMRSFRIYKGYIMPLWVVEGLAEYAAQDWDAEADLVVRDAVLHDRLVPLTLLDGFSHVENVYLAYKESQLALTFLAERYGEEKLAVFFKKFKNQISVSQVLHETVGLGLGEFNEQFLYWLRERYWIQTKDRQDLSVYGEGLTGPHRRPTRTWGPAWSPDGKLLAYVSDLDQTPRIYVWSPQQEEGPLALTSDKFEQFSTQGRPLSWSPDGRELAFVARAEGRTSLYLLEVETRRWQRHDLALEDLSSPDWSPDGTRLALVGVSGGVSDIYLWERGTGRLWPLTHDRRPDTTPSWSPDGREVAYATELGEHWQVAVARVADPAAEPRWLTQAEADHIQPDWTPDGRLLFCSDRSGVYDCYRLDPAQGTAVPLTRVRTGALQPSLSPDGKRLAFSGYQKGSWDVYLMSYAAAPGGTTPAAVAVAPPALTATARPSAPVEAPDPIVASAPYGFRFSPDLLFLLAGYDSSQGVVGGGYLTASDFLGQHLVALTSEFVPGYQTQTQLSYVNSSFPVDLGLAAQYRRTYYRLIDLETGTLTDEFNDQQISAALGLSKPFSLYDRFETELALLDLRREHGAEVLKSRRATLRFGLVHDDTSWYDFEPSSGLRHELSWTWADRVLGGEMNYSLLKLNVQAYTPLDVLNPLLVLGARLLAAASVGPDRPSLLFAGIGVLPESGTLRGYRYGDLLGSQVAALNLELRFPLAREVNYSLWPLDFLLIKDLQMVVFDDLGVVSNDLLASTGNDLRNSVGLGLRAHTFLLGKELLTIRFDMAKITDRPAEPYFTWGIGQAF